MLVLRKIISHDDHQGNNFSKHTHQKNNKVNKKRQSYPKKKEKEIRCFTKVLITLLRVTKGQQEFRRVD